MDGTTSGVTAEHEAQWSIGTLTASFGCEEEDAQREPPVMLLRSLSLA